MMSLRQASIVLLVLAAGMVILGAGGFSAMEADRPVSVTVVDDDEAYLSVDAELVEEKDKTAITVTNRFSVSMEVAKIETARDSIELDEWNIDPGEEDQRIVSLGADEVTVHVQGNGVSVTVTTEVKPREI